MFLQRLIERNPGLIEAAIEMHQEGLIPPNTFVFDLDAVYANARILAEGAKRFGFRTYVMTKQHANNPFVTGLALHGGLDSTVAVDVQAARQLHRYGIPVGHLGHLNQVPAHDTEMALSLRPEVITVFSVEAAERISAVARHLGIVQDLLMRPYSPGDIFFTGQEGGFPIEEFAGAARQICRLPNVRIAGVTAFPCISYNNRAEDPVEATPNFWTALRAAGILERELGIPVRQVNAPGNTSSESFPLLGRMGATCVEPGNGLLGTTPNHSFKSGLPEIPCYVYVSEISHHFDGRAYAYGGGLFMDIFDPDFPYQALAGTDARQALENRVRYLKKPVIIDYHAELSPGEKCSIGDSVVFGFRCQIQMTRSYLAMVSGISSGEPVLRGIFDARATMLDEDHDPVSPGDVVEQMHSMLAEYN